MAARSTGRARDNARVLSLGLVTLLVLMLVASQQLVQAQERVINVWSGYPELEPFYRKVAEDFQAARPDVRINILTHPLRDYEKKLAAALPSGTAADVIEISASWIARFVQAGLMAEAPPEVASFVRSEAYNDFLTNAASYQGKVYGVPFFRGQGVLFYNTKMFEEAGLTRPPQTMEEIAEYARRLTCRKPDGQLEVQGISLRLGGGGAGIAEKFWIWMHQWDGAVIRQTPDGKWVNGYDNEAGRKTLQMYLDMLYKDKVVDINMRQDAEAFQLEQAAMFVRESWVIGDTAQKAPNLQYATAPLPRGTISLPVNLYVPVSSRQKDVAWEFILFALKPEYQVWLLRHVGWLPNRQDVDYSSVLEEIPQFGAFVENPPDFVYFTLPPVPVIDEILTRLAERLVLAWNNPALANDPAGVDRALREAAQETDSILRRAGLLGTP